MFALLLSVGSIPDICPFARLPWFVPLGRRHLFPALPVERRAGLAVISGRQPQLLFRRHLQPGRRLHLGGSGLSADFPVQILQIGSSLQKNPAKICGGGILRIFVRTNSLVNA